MNRNKVVVYKPLRLDVLSEQRRPLMIRKKTLLLFFPTLIFLYFLYKVVRLNEPVIPALLILSQTPCNASTTVLQSNGSPVTLLQDDKDCPIGDLVYANYCAVSYNKESSEDANRAPLTLSTQGTVEFLHHVVVLCHRWSGPISVAVYSPAEDYKDARQLVNTLRKCDFCVRYWVSWHFFFYKDHPPNDTDTEDSWDCDTILNGQRHKRRSQGIYPINVGRNLARSRSATRFVFPIDIELYPSYGILPMFERMLRSVDSSEGFRVWVLPVFEVYAKYRAPTTKSELRAMFAKKKAISFHRYRCDMCHRIPNLTEWLDHEVVTKTELNETMEPLKIFTTVKRSKKYHLEIWEPFFIGTRDDPEFDVRLSWEGKQNKMQVAYEMCLMDYDFHIVSNAFLVHSPGINYFNPAKEKWRDKYAVQNDKLIVKIRKDLVRKYGKNKDC